MSKTRTAAGTGVDESTLQRLLDAIKGLRYGSVEIVIHDGKVVQIERSEKIRFDAHRPITP